MAISDSPHAMMRDMHHVRSSPSKFPGAAISVETLLFDHEITDLVCLVDESASIERMITHPRIQKNGLSLAGHMQGVVPTRVQILGETEISFLESLSSEICKKRCQQLFALELSLVIVTRGVNPPKALCDAASETQTPLGIAKLRSSQTIAVIHSVLDQRLAPSETRHGVLIDVHGMGTLLFGPSGIGKSECALFLVERGHRFVADDQVVLTRTPAGTVIGRPPPLLRHHLELRGVGIINVRELFGATAVRDDKTVELVVELCPWDSEREFDRLGLEDLRLDLLGVSLPMLRVPVQPGRNMAVILEVAARNHLLKVGEGGITAHDFIAQIDAQRLREKG